MPLISEIDDQKSDKTTISASAEGTKEGGRLRRTASSCSIACAILSMTLLLAVGFINPGMPTRSPPATRSSASAKVTISVRSSLLSRAPVDALRRLAGDEAAILPEAFAGAGAAAAVQAVDHVGGDAAGFKDETRQRSGERTAFAIGTSDCCDLQNLVLVGCGHQPIRVFNCLITSGMVRPSARAVNV